MVTERTAVRYMDATPEEQYEEAFRQVLAHRTMLKGYIQAIVRDLVLAEDTFSDVTLQIVRSWPNYDRTREFPRWARGVARRVALATLRKRGRAPVHLDESLIDEVGADLTAAGDEVELETRKHTLQSCLELLSTKNRELVRLRYFENCSYLEIADRIGRSVGALYVGFNRIHEALEKCIEEKMRAV